MSASYELATVKDVEANSSATGNSMTWDSVSFSVGEKEILVGANGSVQAGEICAILGPSGAGKSSLLNVLAGRSAPSPGINISGNVKVGGKAVNPVAFRRNIAYVMQDDSLMATATPTEALTFSARLRLGEEVTDAQIAERVAKLIDTLGLRECADVMVGGEMIKGISGGQRKRTSVGVEVVTDPSLLFLDEPTSGLDSFTALSMVQLLKTLSGSSTAVLCTIHQPSAEVFYLFDKVIFMKQGRIFYQGSAAAATDYFSKLDMTCPLGHNIADHIMALSQKISHEEATHKKMYMVLDADDSDGKKSIEDVGEYTPTPGAGFISQLWALLGREASSIVRDKMSLFGRFGITIFLNSLFGAIFWKAGNTDNADPTNFQNHFGAITMVAISSMFGSAQPVMLGFPFERPMFMREYSTGTYSAAAYAIVKTLTDMPLSLAQCLVQYAVVFPMIQFQGNFLLQVVAAWMLGIGASSIGMMVGCAVTDVKTVSEMAPVLFVPQLLFAGFFIATDSIPLFLRWAQYLCGIKYAMNLILITEFDPTNESCTSSDVAALACEKALSTNDIDADDSWIYYLMLVAIFLFFRTVAVFLLVSKSKRFY